MRDDMVQYLNKNGVTFYENYGVEPPLAELARKVDVFYVTQVPMESFGDRLDDYEASKGQFVIDRRVLKCMKKNSIIMHPLPRQSEVAPEVDKDLRAVYFKQIHYGLCIRMALLCAVLQRFP
jgi:aspartate carbamoyltransferase catalytic subunit